MPGHPIRLGDGRGAPSRSTTSHRHAFTASAGSPATRYNSFIAPDPRAAPPANAYHAVRGEDTQVSRIQTVLRATHDNTSAQTPGPSGGANGLGPTSSSVYHDAYVILSRAAKERPTSHLLRDTPERTGVVSDPQRECRTPADTAAVTLRS